MKSAVFWCITLHRVVIVYHTMQCNTPEDRRLHQHHGRSLKSSILFSTFSLLTTFSILQFLAVSWQLWSLHLSTSHLASLLINYHIFFPSNIFLGVLDPPIPQMCPAQSCLLCWLCVTKSMSLYKAQTSLYSVFHKSIRDLEAWPCSSKPTYKR
jgi:hypothetical protein